MSITAAEPLAIEVAGVMYAFESTEPAPTEPAPARPVTVPPAVFSLMQTMLLAETFFVIFVRPVDVRSLSGVFIAVLLGVALLGNFIAGVIAGHARGALGRRSPTNWDAALMAVPGGQSWF